MKQSKRQAIININTKLAYKGGLFCVLGSFIIIRSSAGALKDEIPKRTNAPHRARDDRLFFCCTRCGNDFVMLKSSVTGVNIFI